MAIPAVTKGHFTPAEWRAFSRALIKARGGRCQRCGHDGSLTTPFPSSPHIRHPNPLTVHHINWDPADNRDQNLAVLCASCHFQVQHGDARERRREAQKLAGQGTLWKEE